MNRPLTFDGWRKTVAAALLACACFASPAAALDRGAVVLCGLPLGDCRGTLALVAFVPLKL